MAVRHLGVRAQPRLLHIAFNMYALWIMGTYLEPLLGRARFVGVYLLSAIGGSVVYLLLSPPAGREHRRRRRGDVVDRCVGASGAVFGLFGAFLVLQRRLGRSAAGMYVVIGINAVLGFVIPGIAWQAHLGGLVTGAALRGRHRLHRAQPRSAPAAQPRVHWAALGGVLVVLVVLTLAKYAGRSEADRHVSPRPGRALDYTGVIHPQWGQLRRRKTLGPSGQRQRVVMRKPESMRPKPTARFQRPSWGHGILVGTGDVVGHDPDEADDHEAEHDGHEPARVGAPGPSARSAAGCRRAWSDPWTRARRLS